MMSWNIWKKIRKIAWFLFRKNIW